MALIERMRALAETHVRADELRKHAGALEIATAGFAAEPQTVDVKSFVGAYARAKRLWTECSGEPLVSPAAIDAGAKLLTFLRDAARR